MQCIVETFFSMCVCRYMPLKAQVFPHVEQVANIEFFANLCIPQISLYRWELNINIAFSILQSNGQLLLNM